MYRYNATCEACSCQGKVLYNIPDEVKSKEFKVAEELRGVHTNHVCTSCICKELDKFDKDDLISSILDWLDEIDLKDDEINTLTDNVDEMKQNVESLKEKVSEFEEKLHDRESELHDMTREMNNLQSENTKLQNRVEDSYERGYSDGVKASRDVPERSQIADE